MPTPLDNLAQAGFNRTEAETFLQSAPDAFTEIATSNFGQIQNILNQGLDIGLSDLPGLLGISTAPVGDTANPTTVDLTKGPGMTISDLNPGGENGTVTPQTDAEKAEALLGGAFQSSITPETIADKLAAERKAREAQAIGIFDPRIRRAGEVGAAQVSTAEGVTGQRAGFALSTAEMSFLQDAQTKVDVAIKEIQNSKDAFISSGDAEALARADAALSSLEDRKQQFLLKRADLALQLGAAGREEERLGLAKQELSFNQEQALKQFDFDKTKFNLALDEFSFRKEQFGEEKAMQWAQLMGFAQDDKGNMIPTLGAKQYEETVRHNRVIEGIQMAEQARLSAGTKTVDMENMTDEQQAAVRSWAVGLESGKYQPNDIPTGLRTAVANFGQQLFINGIVADGNAEDLTEEELKAQVLAAGGSLEEYALAKQQAGISLDTAENIERVGSSGNALGEYLGTGQYIKSVGQGLTEWNKFWANVGEGITGQNVFIPTSAFD